MTSLIKPTKQQVEAIVPMLSAPDHERYFFDNLKNPHWIGELKTLGFFKNPPVSEKVEGGGVRCQHWPQSQYLVRMAPLAPEEVTDVLSEVETDNWVVVRDIIRATKAMPAVFAAKLAPKIGVLVKRSGLGHELDAVGKIVAKLVEGNETDVAVSLFKSVFAVDGHNDIVSTRKYDGYIYFKAVNDSIIPALIPVRATELVELLSNWMMVAFGIENDGRVSDAYFLCTWRPAIEDHEQNHDSGSASMLLSAVRDAFELAIREGHLSLGDSLGKLAQQEHRLFWRLRLHLIAEFADKDQELARRTMLDQSLFCDFVMKHEYARLMGRRFGLLSEDQKNEWIGWIEAGPEQMEADSCDESSEEPERQQRREYWQFQRLYWIRNHLAGRWREFYDRMHKEHGRPYLADMHRYTESYWGHQSPYTIEELSEMGFGAAVDAVSRWQLDPQQARGRIPSVEGLAENFGRYVASDPVQFSSQASLLKRKPAVFVHAFLGAIKGAIKEKKDVHLAEVLDLCEWVVARPIEEDTSRRNDEDVLVDRSWQWCRDEIAELLQGICEAEDETKQREYGLELREGLLALIKPLLGSPAKPYAVQDDAGKDPRVENWLSMALNSPRGKAMQTLFAYVDWLVDHLVDDRMNQPSFPGGLAKIPEVRDLLEAQLSGADGCFNARAMMGSRLGLLHWLDAQWLQERAATIFDIRSTEQDPSLICGWAAWNTFLFANRPHIVFYRMLRDQFSYAVDQARTIEELPDSQENPFSLLAEHLMILFGRGNLGRDASEALQADNAIIERLVTASHQSVRSHALEFVGRSLNDGGEKLTEDVADRLMRLWEYYWQVIGAEDAKRDPGSRVFGYWFSAGVFDAEWSIVQLEKFVAASPKAEPDGCIMKRLATICNVDPHRSARIVGMLVDGDVDYWRIPSWEDEAKMVLGTALKAGGDAREVAKQVVDRLGRRGFLEFGELIDEDMDDG